MVMPLQNLVHGDKGGMPGGAVPPADLILLGDGDAMGPRVAKFFLMGDWSCGMEDSAGLDVNILLFPAAGARWLLVLTGLFVIASSNPAEAW